MAEKKYSVDDILKIFNKLNKRIEDLYCFVKECCAKVPVNVGIGIGIYKKFNQNKWEFKSLLPGAGVNITEGNNEITISATAQPVSCDDIKDCLGITESGDPDKYLNEQGDWVTITVPPAFIESVSDTSNIDLTVTGTDLTADLTDTTVTPNTYGDATNIPQITVDQKGRVTSVVDVPISIPPTITFETNGTPNGDQTLLNLKDGTNISITDDGLGGITIDASGGIPHGTASGTDTYTITITGVTAYNDGDAYLIRFTNGNTTGCTLNINSLGAINLYRNNDGQLIGGDIISGAEMLCIYNSTLNAFQTIGTAPNTLIGYVTNDDSVPLTKGMAVYAFSGVGDRMTVKRANNTSDATSAQTVGLVLSTSIGVNQKGFIMMQGLLDGLGILPTSTFADGDPVYLGSTPGSITNVKPYAPNHLVYLGVVTTANNGNSGRMYVKVQNGYELDELHNVQAQSPSVNDVLYYFGGSPGQWKTASISTILGYTPLSAAITSLGVSGSPQTGATQTLATGTTGTDFNITSSTNTHTFNLPTASATNTGKLSSTDWSKFDSASKLTLIGSFTSVSTVINLPLANTLYFGASVLIPANSFQNGDIFWFTTRGGKDDAGSTTRQTAAVISTSSGVTSGTQIGYYATASAGNRYMVSLDRRFVVTSTGMYGVDGSTNTTASIFSDLSNGNQSSSSLLVSYTINFAINQYINICFSTTAASAPNANLYNIEVWRIRP